MDFKNQINMYPCPSDTHPMKETWLCECFNEPVRRIANLVATIKHIEYRRGTFFSRLLDLIEGKLRGLERAFPPWDPRGPLAANLVKAAGSLKCDAKVTLILPDRVVTQCARLFDVQLTYYFNGSTLHRKRLNEHSGPQFRSYLLKIEADLSKALENSRHLIELDRGRLLNFAKTHPEVKGKDFLRKLEEEVRSMSHLSPAVVRSDMRSIITGVDDILATETHSAHLHYGAAEPSVPAKIESSTTTETPGIALPKLPCAPCVASIGSTPKDEPSSDVRVPEITPTVDQINNLIQDRIKSLRTDLETKLGVTTNRLSRVEADLRESQETIASLQSSAQALKQLVTEKTTSLRDDFDHKLQDISKEVRLLRHDILDARYELAYLKHKHDSNNSPPTASRSAPELTSVRADNRIAELGFRFESMLDFERHVQDIVAVELARRTQENIEVEVEDSISAATMVEVEPAAYPIPLMTPSPTPLTATFPESGNANAKPNANTTAPSADLPLPSPVAASTPEAEPEYVFTPSTVSEISEDDYQILEPESQIRIPAQAVELPRAPVSSKEVPAPMAHEASHDTVIPAPAEVHVIPDTTPSSTSKPTAPSTPVFVAPGPLSSTKSGDDDIFRALLVQMQSIMSILQTRVKDQTHSRVEVREPIVQKWIDDVVRGLAPHQPARTLIISEVSSNTGTHSRATNPSRPAAHAAALPHLSVTSPVTSPTLETFKYDSRGHTKWTRHHARAIASAKKEDRPKAESGRAEAYAKWPVAFPLLWESGDPTGLGRERDEREFLGMKSRKGKAKA